MCPSDCQFFIQHFDKQIKVGVNVSLSMVDGKLHSLVTGLGGALCCLCTYSKEQCNNADHISSGFQIARSLEQTLAVCETEVHHKENR